MNTLTNPSFAAGLPRPNADAPQAARFDLGCAGQNVALARAWLVLGLAALVGSGLFAVLLVAARTPGVNAWLSGADAFRMALVVHVDLSVLVWFVAMAGLMWRCLPRRASAAGARLDRAIWLLAALGTAALALAPFVDPGTPVMANYVPVLESRTFVAGLLLFGAAATLLALRTLGAGLQIGRALARGPLDGSAALGLGLVGAALCMVIAALAFAWSALEVPRALDSRAYWEILFWGGGHALQFTWTLLMLVAWLWLADACGARVPLSPRVVALLFAIALAAVFVTPYAYFTHAVTSIEHRVLNTWGMRIGGGLAILPVALAVVVGLLQRQAAPDGTTTRPLRAALLASMLLFAAGGVIGTLIDGSNVKIPAHYHGCIVGVTLALMGVVFHLLPRLGYRAPAGRLAVLQPWIYGCGQLLHIIGLVWSGGYGVQRKVAGSEQVLRSASEVFGMGLMGAGGAIAIIGGLLFLVVVLRAMRAAPDLSHASGRPAGDAR